MKDNLETLKVFDEIANPIVVLNSLSEVIYYNLSFLTYSKTKPRNYKKKITLGEIFDFADIEISEYISGCINDAKLLKTSEIEFKTIDKTHSSIATISFSPIIINSQNSVVVSFNDVTEEVSLQRKYKENVRVLKESHELLLHEHKLITMGEMAAEMAHEVNNPLAIISGNIQLLEFSLIKKNINEKEKITNVNNAVERIAKIVKGMKGLSRGSGDEESLFDLTTVANETVDLFKSVAKSKFEVVKDYSNEKIEVLGDPVRMQQVLTNLLTNAEDSLENQDKKVITVSIKYCPPSIKLEVSDTGCGIPDELREKIFEGFFTTKEIGKGTGLGMGVISTIVENMNGTLSLDSTVGKGTTFKMRFPIPGDLLINSIDSSIDDSDNVLPLEDFSKIGKILVVEDEEDIREILECFLEDEKADITLVGDAETALEKLKTEDFRIVMTDFRLPGKTGLDLAMDIKSQYADKNISVILVSGSVSTAKKENHKIEFAVFDEVIEKPFTDIEIKNKVKAALKAG